MKQTVDSRTKVSRDAAVALAGNVVKTTYEDLPREVTEVTKKCIMDTLGVTIAASTLGEGCRELVELAKEGAGKEESTVLGFGGKLPCWMTAFANGSMSHALDYDDVLDAGLTHLSMTTVVPGLPIAERLGKVSGKEFIAAVALGNELIARLCLAVSRRPEGWQPTWMGTPLLGVFSAAATCGKLLKLDHGQMVNALGIALNMAAGSHEIAFSPTSNLRGLYGAFPAKAGVLSALMAQRGITTSENCFEGEAGLFKMYYAGSYHKESLTEKIGELYEFSRVSLKPWPSCRTTHPHIDAALQVARQHKLNPSDIKQIKVYVGDLSMKLCQPLEGRRRPDTVMTAKWSIPFSVAAAIAKRQVTLGDFSLEGIRNPAILDVSRKVVPHFDPRFTDPNGVPPAMVEVEMTTGQTYSKKVQLAYGNPDNPMSDEALVAKFKDCVSYSARPISESNTQKVISMLLNLEEVSDIRQVVRLLVS